MMTAREQRNKVDYRMIDTMIREVVKNTNAKRMKSATLSIPTVASKMGVSNKVAGILIENRASQMRYKTQKMGAVVMIKW